MPQLLTGAARQASSPSARRSAAHYRWTAAATVAIAVLAWPFDVLTPGIDWEWNWVAGLALTAKESLDFGDEVIWTYGPLGFLDFGPLLYYTPIAWVSMLYQAILQLLLAGTVFTAVRRSYPAGVAFVLALVVVAMAPIPVLALGFTWCVLAVTREDREPRDANERMFPVAVGALAGVALLGKINVGVEVLLLAVIALVARSGRRGSDAAIFVAAIAATATAGWVATGQELGNVWPYVRYSVEIVVGYAAAMGKTDPALAWHYWVGLLAFSLASVVVWDATRSIGRRQRWGLAALWAIYAYLGFKAGFVRHDGHAGLFMVKMLLAVAVLPVRSPRRWLPVVGIAICVAAIASIRQASVLDQLNPYRNASALVEQVAVLGSSSRRAAELSRQRERIAEHYKLPSAFVDEIGSRTVAFWPYAFGDLPYAYGFDWRPLPVLEPYAAYTPALDETGADLLRSPMAPERIVRSTRTAIDGRVATFESPLTTRAILCRYGEMDSAEPWQLLARSRGTRCGTPRVTARKSADWGQPVDVPRPRRSGSAVLVAIDGTAPAGIERLKALWLRPDPRAIVLDRRPYRLVAATASEGLVLHVPPAADYRPPFAMAPNPERIAVRRSGDDQPSGDLRYTFFELPIEPPTAIEAG